MVTPSRVSPRIVAIQFDGLRTRHRTIEEGRAEPGRIGFLAAVALALGLIQPLPERPAELQRVKRHRGGVVIG